MEVIYSPSFVRQYKSLQVSLKLEVKQKIALFQDEKNHQSLKVHKLKGKLKEQYSFYVNYKIRIVFWYTEAKPREALLLAIGDHDVYNE